MNPDAWKPRSTATKPKVKMYTLEYQDSTGEWIVYRKFDASRYGIHEVLAIFHRKVTNTGYAWRLTTPSE